MTNYFRSVLVASIILLSPIPSFAFSFDLWHSGITINQAMDAAESRDIPLHRAGLISDSKHFSPQISRAFAKSANEFYYKTDLLGRPAQITLYFTRSSRVLYRVVVQWSRISDSGFPEAVSRSITGKCGEPSQRTKKLSYQVTTWKASDGEIVMKAGAGMVKVSYVDPGIQN